MQETKEEKCWERNKVKGKREKRIVRVIERSDSKYTWTKMNFAKYNKICMQIENFFWCMYLGPWRD